MPVRPKKVTRLSSYERKPIAATLRHFAVTNLDFRAACERAKVQPTIRQASKFKRGYGSAYAAR